RLHVDKRLGDGFPGLVDYLEPDVVGRGAYACCGLQPSAAAGDRPSQGAGQVQLGVGGPGGCGERRAVPVESLDVPVQVAVQLGRDPEAERDWPLDERLGAPGEDLEGDPSLPVTLLDGSYE